MSNQPKTQKVAAFAELLYELAAELELLIIAAEDGEERRLAICAREEFHCAVRAFV